MNRRDGHHAYSAHGQGGQITGQHHPAFGDGGGGSQLVEMAGFVIGEAIDGQHKKNNGIEAGQRQAILHGVGEHPHEHQHKHQHELHLAAHQPPVLDKQALHIHSSSDI